MSRGWGRVGKHPERPGFFAALRMTQKKTLRVTEVETLRMTEEAEGHEYLYSSTT
jgi:hypothetical protein